MATALHSKHPRLQVHTQVSGQRRKIPPVGSERWQRFRIWKIQGVFVCTRGFRDGDSATVGKGLPQPGARGGSSSRLELEPFSIRGSEVPVASDEHLGDGDDDMGNICN